MLDILLATSPRLQRRIRIPALLGSTLALYWVCGKPRSLSLFLSSHKHLTPPLSLYAVTPSCLVCVCAALQGVPADERCKCAAEEKPGVFGSIKNFFGGSK